MYYIIASAVIAFFVWKIIRQRAIKMKLPEFLSEGALIIDVRSKGEFASGCAPGSLNIPLDTLQSQLSRLERRKPIVVCCASGARSEVAASILRKNGFPKVLNAGSWMALAK